MKLNKKLIKEGCENRRKDGDTIVFTNGCFDLLHKGHLDLLLQASKLGDCLIIGLNSDNSVRLLKGNNRPVEGQKTRMGKLLKLQYVQEVYIFNEQTPIELIKIIKPDILVKGADYLHKEIVGSREVLDWGGRVEFIPLTAGYSTTKIINSDGREDLV